jgi:hypothetical protein
MAIVSSGNASIAVIQDPFEHHTMALLIACQMSRNRSP